MLSDEKMEILERTLPLYLKHDIEAWKERERIKSPFLDCLWGELYGSINSAFYSNEITEEEADALREKYLGLGE